MVFRIFEAFVVWLFIQNVNANPRAAVFPCEFRSITGYGNNVYHPDWGLLLNHSIG